VRILLAGAAIYAVLLATAVLFQRRLIYFPFSAYKSTPDAAGLPYLENMLVTRDGTQVCAWHVPADGADAPAVIYLHGNHENLGGLVPLASSFRRSGFAFIAVDYRGYGKSRGTPTEAGLYADADAAADWAAALGYRPERTLVWGQSLGAGVAAHLAASRTLAGLVLEGAFPSIAASARLHYPFLAVPEAFIRDRYPTAENASQALCPVLVLQGGRDSIAPPRFGSTVFNSAREPKFFCLVPEAGHNDITPETAEVAKALAEFRKTCLK